MADEQFETHPENPFVRRDGDSLDIAYYNRIAAIDRINYLVRQSIPEFDLRVQPQVYLYDLDVRMWKSHYHDKGMNVKIDEEFCQVAAKTCVEMEQPSTLELVQEVKVAKKPSFLERLKLWIKPSSSNSSQT